MRDWRSICKSINVKVEARIHPFMDYLEQRGKRFCIDFGHITAEEIAKKQMESDLKGKISQ